MNDLISSDLQTADYAGTCGCLLPPLSQTVAFVQTQWSCWGDRGLRDVADKASDGQRPQTCLQMGGVLLFKQQRLQLQRFKVKYLKCPLSSKTLVFWSWNSVNPYKLLLDNVATQHSALLCWAKWLLCLLMTSRILIIHLKSDAGTDWRNLIWFFNKKHLALHYPFY